MNSGIAVLFVAGPLIVVPLLLRVLPTLHAPTADRAIGSASRVALPAAVLLASSFALAPGPFAASLAVPWLGVGVLTASVAGVAAAVGLRDGTIWRPGPGHALLVALVFLPVAGANAVADRLGVQPFGFSPTIVLLTAVHFTFAGFALLVVGAMTYPRIPRRWLEVALGGVVIGVPITAAGFFGVPVASWLGALLVAGGGLGIGVGLVRAAGLGQTPWSRRLTLVAGVSLLISMPLAVIYATGAWLDASWLDIPTMASVHGMLNVAGFAVPAAIALTEESRIARPVVPAVVAPPSSAGRRWAIGFATGLVMGVGLLIGGPLIGVLGVVAVGALAATPPRLAGMAGFWLGFGTAWLVLFASAQARCGVDCVAPDPTPWLVAGFVGLAFGAGLTFAAGPRRTTRIAGGR